MHEASQSRSAADSGRNIADVNMDASDAATTHTFGRQTETGGTRWAGWDACQACTRRASKAMSYSIALPLPLPQARHPIWHVAHGLSASPHVER